MPAERVAHEDQRLLAPHARPRELVHRGHVARDEVVVRVARRPRARAARCRRGRGSRTTRRASRVATRSRRHARALRPVERGAPRHHRVREDGRPDGVPARLVHVGAERPAVARPEIDGLAPRPAPAAATRDRAFPCACLLRRHAPRAFALPAVPHCSTTLGRARATTCKRVLHARRQRNAARRGPRSGRAPRRRPRRRGAPAGPPARAGTPS